MRPEGFSRGYAAVDGKAFAASVALVVDREEFDDVWSPASDSVGVVGG